MLQLTIYKQYNITTVICLILNIMCPRKEGTQRKTKVKLLLHRHKITLPDIRVEKL